MVRKDAASSGLRRARGRLEAIIAGKVPDVRGMAMPDIQALVRDLVAHQVELQMCNEELRRAREEIDGSRAKYLQFFDFSPTAYFLLDRDTRILEVNFAGAVLLGAEKSRLKRSKFTRFVAPADRAALELHLRETIETGARKRCILRLVKKDGAPLDARLESYCAPYVGEARCFTAIMDITELHRAQADLRYQAGLLDDVSEAIISTDLDFRVLSWNKAAEEIYGWRAEEMMGRRFTDVVQTEFPGGIVFEDHLQRFRHEGHWRGEIKQTRKDGATVEVWTSTSALRDSADKIVGFVGVNRDITERKKMDEAVRERDERLRLLVANSPDTLFHQDSELRYRWGANMADLSQEQIIGKTDFELLPVEEANRLTAAKRRVLESGNSAREEFCLTIHGKPAYYDTVLEPQRDASGRVVGLFGYARDVTERKRLEEELRALTRRVVESQEEERREMARELHSEVSQYLAFLKMLIERGQRSTREFHLGEMKEAVEEVISSVSNLALNLRPPILDDLGLLPALLWYFERYTAQTGVRVEFRHRNLKGQFPREVATAAYRIVQGALTNVARHAGVSEVTVSASLARECLRLRIEDRGVGFVPNALPIGASVGLNGMRERALSLGGSLVVDTAPGAGTRVMAELPLPEPQREREKKP
ncbi:MAG: PAS domain S-box protein [Chloroflexi bacterium]|nr:PAS domain S-box protein [Chloroflexota bacterium]